MSDPREPYGRLVHEKRLAFNAEKERPFVLLPWEDRDDGQRELDMTIGAAVAAAERERMAEDLEAEGSPLCDCRHPGGSVPTSPRTGQQMPHHCECRAVVTSEAIRAGRSVTRHHRECVCGPDPQERSDEKEADRG